MRKTIATAFVAAGVAALAFSGTAAANGPNSGAFAGALSLVNIDASDAAHWQICGQNVFAQSYSQVCDNRDHIGGGPQSGAYAGDLSIANVDISDAAHWQICGQNVGVSPSLVQKCQNTDHMPVGASMKNTKTTHKHSK
ncbi:hypothetical protein Afil01_58620 [Actinorhabdospora filicis]|uniref:Secreted protein n=1 Tax=Actinorhabdospora filicis TaxID=1785913 RepID=A0A9W6SQE6_9ACTN|nr:hypothetical protein [Actinorhabdospora filicis]GLZ81055.1 hypothetical protein Afil01_58620 [Actinorhabdospora filicis]